jgi:hypothetical protein
MGYRFPLGDVIIVNTREKQRVTAPLFEDFYCSMNQDEFSMEVEGVGCFYVSRGNFISVVPCRDASPDAIELYLNGSVYGVILHQRKILPMHGSSFLYGGRGIMICGDAGAGKSSLTASFCLNGAGFLTDDITPVVFRDSLPYIWPMSDTIKLWGDTLKQLEKAEEGLQRIYPDTEKYYFPMSGNAGNIYRLDQVYVLEVKDKGEISFAEITGIEKFTALRGEIYRKEYLEGMPENERLYLSYLVDISNNVKIFRVSRPLKAGVSEVTKAFLDWVRKYEIFHEGVY